ncbi:winged helix-turn-helix transcriptional regulator [Pedobacter cryoconitis]|uniref:DNA-binding HxlR family transcriptional regulator n=1 Tax=Pedobacter cryoconitis TaxID=188932 RepID=A0A7X0MIT9_9SPHI|nr:helix-turn-helix domain-containing protein [Pedobacter cryoconitis]MBB6498798.1 DNA-binding HxlR family transcriptional regulator [Pedobacter cryoconitis]
MLKIIGKRWVSEILVLIGQDISRFSQLKECLNGISDNVLSSVLNELVKSELVKKEIFQQVPLKVEYHITKSGSDLTKVMHELCNWGKQHIPYEVRIQPAKKKSINT